MPTIMRFALLVLLALLVGTMFGIWVGFNPVGLSAAAYVEEQQSAIRSLNTLLPAMGAACVLLTVALAFMSTDAPRTRYLLFAAAAFMVVAGLVTRFANQPLNAVVMTWRAEAPGANWAQLRDEWWQWHIVPSLMGIAALRSRFWIPLRIPLQPDTSGRSNTLWDHVAGKTRGRRTFLDIPGCLSDRLVSGRSSVRSR